MKSWLIEKTQFINFKKKQKREVNQINEIRN